jgi:hypothetical protein
MNVSSVLYVIALILLVISFFPPVSYPLEKVSLLLVIIGLLVPVFTH